MVSINDIDQFLQTSGEKMVDKVQIAQEMVDKWSIKPSLAEKLADIVGWMADKDAITIEQVVTIFGYPETTAKRYLRQLTSFGYLEQHGGNRNRSYHPLSVTEIKRPLLTKRKTVRTY